jgi:NAD(P)-dependent dehydrogenase (short-subunit alcohol dehydrogenase family)
LEADGAKAVAVVGDVADPETARRAVAAAVEAFGKLDVLFNNAGVMTSGDFRSFDEAAWDAVLNPNLRGIYLMCHAAIPHMLERGEGAIVNTSSVMAFLTEPGYEAYTTSKAGIIGLTKALAVSYAEHGVRANCVCPGWVDTPMNRRLAEELGGMDKLVPIIKRQQPLPRMITTREVGNAVVSSPPATPAASPAPCSASTAPRRRRSERPSDQCVARRVDSTSADPSRRPPMPTKWARKVSVAMSISNRRANAPVGACQTRWAEDNRPPPPNGRHGSGRSLASRPGPATPPPAASPVLPGAAPGTRPLLSVRAHVEEVTVPSD